MQALVAILALAAIHVGIGLVPAPPFSMGVNLALFFTNLFVVLHGGHGSASPVGALGAALSSPATPRFSC
jgi:hypothetical protein